jgi:hypothetical protein
VGEKKTIDVDLFSDAPTPAWQVKAFAVGKELQLDFGPHQSGSDVATGSNGDKLQLTITRLGPNPDPSQPGSGFVLFSASNFDPGGSVRGIWVGYVGDPASASDGGVASTSGGPAPSTCTPSAGASPCTACAETNCCAEVKACGAQPECAALIRCLETCSSGDQSCDDNCAAQHPGATSTWQAALSCAKKSCATQCQ